MTFSLIGLASRWQALNDSLLRGDLLLCGSNFALFQECYRAVDISSVISDFHVLGHYARFTTSIFC